jgi:putative tricarboxylic transport membrane protein
MSKERLGSFGFLLVGIFGLSQAVRLPLGSMEKPGPGVFPVILSGLLCMIGASLLFSEKGQGRLAWGTIARQKARVWQIVLQIGVFILTLEWLGYPLASALFLFPLLSWTCGFRVGQAAGLTALLTVASWYLFVKFLGVQLPPGLLRLP